MNRIQLPSFEPLSLGYKFDHDRETVSLIYINYFLILLFITVIILLHAQDEELLPVSYRYHSIIFIGFLELWLIRKHRLIMARVLILTLTPFLILILPPLAGLFDNEFYFWFPYIPIALSLLPHFILHPVRNRASLVITLVVYFFLGLFIDNFMIFLSNGEEEIIPIVKQNSLYYNLIPAFIYIFVNMSLGLLFWQNTRYEEIMHRQQEDLSQAEKMASLGTLTAGVAHEINNPLNFISGSLHAQKTLTEEYVRLEEKISPEKEKLLQQIDQIRESSFEGVRRASDIIKSLRFFASPKQEKKKDFNLDQLLYAVLQAFESEAPGYITLTKQIQPGMKVRCHEEQLQQVFTSILDNALDAIKSKGKRGAERIEITAREEKVNNNRFVRISIGNSGPLIPEESIKQIFDPFFTSKEAGEGKGLGMTISYMIVSEHNGRIEIKNENEQVVFDVILPLNFTG